MKRSQIRNLDKLWSTAIRSRDGACVACGKTNCRLEAAHIMGRRYRTLRWSLDNGITLCKPCHQVYDEHLPGHDYIKDEIIGKSKYKWLEMQKEVIAKNQDYDLIRKSLVG